MINKINIRFYVLIALIIGAGLTRFVPFLNHYTAMGAMALFGGAYFSEKTKAYFMPLFSLFLSDVIIQGVVHQGKYGFPLYEGWYWIYGTFALIVFLGNLIITKVNTSKVLAASITAAVTHWVITDFWVWYSGCNASIYTKDIHGFILCYTMAIPYMLNFFIGTVLYSIVLFGGFELAQRRFPILAKTN